MANHLENRAIVDDYIARNKEYLNGHELVVCEDLESIKREIADADVMIGWKITPNILACAKKLKWIQFGSAGIDHTIFPELLASDIVLTNLSGIHTAPVAEHVLALMLGLTRRLDIAIRQQKEHTWDRSEMARTSDELFEKTIGIIGLGKIGLSVARIAKAFGMRVIGTKLSVGETLPNVDAIYLSDELDKVLMQSNFLVLVVPLTIETKAMIGKRELDMMPNGAYLINVARGAMLDHEALAEALASGKLKGAALDVFLQEPIPSDSPIYDLPNTIITPHTGGSTPRYGERGSAIFKRNLDAFLSGGEMINVYDKGRGY